MLTVYFSLFGMRREKPPSRADVPEVLEERWRVVLAMWRETCTEGDEICALLSRVRVCAAFLDARPLGARRERCIPEEHFRATTMVRNRPGFAIAALAKTRPARIATVSTKP